MNNIVYFQELLYPTIHFTGVYSLTLTIVWNVADTDAAVTDSIEEKLLI